MLGAYDLACPPQRVGIGVTITPNDSLDTYENLIKAGGGAASIYSERTSLTIDGIQTPKIFFSVTSGIQLFYVIIDGQRVGDWDGGPYWMNWYPILLPGKHHAVVQVLNLEDKIKIYEWDFLITIW